MNVKINGKDYSLEKNSTLNDIIGMLNLSSDNIVADVNGVIITRDKFSSINICDNDNISLIQFVGGG